ncbi:hypothetical protein Rsub_01800 [Raphidocelis subcapitata]|uniref:RING-CH-type domain-containing protein n=1 Tax=Raphidocelis subcapitata TaxID=307507 RepID=A0A2V0NU56_9CHLO|nr:hypothetical protein Rsub_01800 [Raphidocelis subcapitata]|eukprot:GBF89083.1 hypothetical protein Rsub_01800 [Raphidocelis subcapitata]
MEEAPCCWVCLGGDREAGRGPLTSPCACPRPSHPECLARWQLRKAGTREGTHCRFCSHQLPPWTAAAPAGPASAASCAPPRPPSQAEAEADGVLAVVTIHAGGAVHEICVPAGEEGRAAFKRQVEKITGVAFDDECLEVTFEAADPFAPDDDGSTLTLQGLARFDDAVACALLRAHSDGGGGAGAGGGGGSPRGGARGARRRPRWLRRLFGACLAPLVTV